MTSRLPDWNDLHDILLIHDAGSLSAAARLAGVSQSTMSRRLAAIEAGGCKVFERESDGRPLLTERGAILVEAARQMQATYKGVVEETVKPKAPLRIAACEVTAQLFMADALPVWSRAGDIPIDMAIYEDLFALKPTDYDILVTPADSLPAGVTGVEIGRICWGLYASPSYLRQHPVGRGANSLDGHLVICASGSLVGVGTYRWLAEQGGKAAMFSSSPLAQREACARGLGIALLPLNLAEGDQRLELLDMMSFEESPVWLLADIHDANHSRVAAFIRWARRHFKANRPRIPVDALAQKAVQTG